MAAQKAVRWAYPTVAQRADPWAESMVALLAVQRALARVGP